MAWKHTSRKGSVDLTEVARRNLFCMSFLFHSGSRSQRNIHRRWNGRDLRATLDHRVPGMSPLTYFLDGSTFASLCHRFTRVHIVQNLILQFCFSECLLPLSPRASQTNPTDIYNDEIYSCCICGCVPQRYAGVCCCSMPRRDSQGKMLLLSYNNDWSSNYSWIWSANLHMWRWI